MSSSVNSNLWFHLNSVLLPIFRIASGMTSWSLSNLLHPPTLQPHTRIYKMTHISFSLSEKPHPDTYSSKLSTPLTKNVTTRTRQDDHYFLPVKTDMFTLHHKNYLLLPLNISPALESMLFMTPWTENAYRPLWLTSCLAKVLTRCPT